MQSSPADMTRVNQLLKKDACGDGKMPLNVGCQNIALLIQGDENVVAAAADQTFED
jgi:hypothetical protein